MFTFTGHIGQFFMGVDHEAISLISSPQHGTYEMRSSYPSAPSTHIHEPRVSSSPGVATRVGPTVSLLRRREPAHDVEVAPIARHGVLLPGRPHGAHARAHGGVAHLGPEAVGVGQALRRLAAPLALPAHHGHTTLRRMYTHLRPTPFACPSVSSSCPMFEFERSLLPAYIDARLMVRDSYLRFPRSSRSSCGALHPAVTRVHVAP